MREARRIEGVTEVPVAEVLERNRLRPVSDAGVAALISSIEDIGGITYPIQVRQVRHRENELVLIAGAHRLEAARRLEWTTIPAIVWDCADDWARLVEIDDNVGGSELTALDTAIFLAERKDVYERLNPGARHGGDRRSDQVELGSVWSFAAATAEKYGISDRQVRKLVSAGKALAPDERTRLRTAPKPVSLADLQAIGKITNPPERYHVVGALAEGTAKSAADARRSWKARDLPKTETPSPAEKLLDQLWKLWSRASSGVKRRFVERHLDEIAELVAEIDEGWSDA
ncbi:ParB/RepB/Spo0J family partition protein [Roseivivax halotolerans]|uniref:ParB/RepB/Spo0J family partition protein n=1 Tax=Roseivivax halotolerans TaxID=93684 RepID=A0A1I5W364_9RHOB|nr:ParB N-terminal domain-containing protein [Roseivivax halotolerans]SFQ13716.1 ParB/RepB/Spo0J family partition protein [Roseivivax halotolerans]